MRRRQRLTKENANVMLREKKIYIALSALSAVFFVIYLFLYWPGAIHSDNLILNQPDESVNYYFIRDFVLRDNFRVPEPLSLITANQVHPRSTTIIYGALAPIGFPGIIILFGIVLKLLTRIFGSAYFNYFAVALTPLLGALLPILLFNFFKKLTNTHAAFLTAVLAYILPCWWYYSSRPFQHNILFVFLFVCFLLAGARVVLTDNKKIGWVWSLVSGLCLGLSIYVRPNEAIWLLPLALLLLYYFRKKLNWVSVMLFFSVLLFVGWLFMATQMLYYGHFFGSGYVRPQADGSGGVLFSLPGVALAKQILLPFGFHPGTMLKTFWHYGGTLFLAWFIFSSLSFFVGFTRNKQSDDALLPKVYYVFYFFFAFYLLAYYGSWRFTDNVMNLPSIGTSYARYFLPVYIFGLPILAEWLAGLYDWNKFGKVVAVIFVAILLFSSYRAVFAPLEGLNSIKSAVSAYNEWQGAVYSQTEANSIIVTRYADKYLFPGRKIIAEWSSPEAKQAINALVTLNTPVYWFDLKQLKTPVFEKIQLSDTILTIDNLELRKFVGKE